MKKYLKLDVVLSVLFFLDCTVVSVAFVHYSYAWADYYSVFLEHAMRVLGFMGSVFFPCLLVYGFCTMKTDDIIEDLHRTYSELYEKSVGEAE